MSQEVEVLRDKLREENRVGRTTRKGPGIQIQRLRPKKKESVLSQARGIVGDALGKITALPSVFLSRLAVFSGRRKEEKVEEVVAAPSVEWKSTRLEMDPEETEDELFEVFPDGEEEDPTPGQDQAQETKARVGAEAEKGGILSGVRRVADSVFGIKDKIKMPKVPKIRMPDLRGDFEIPLPMAIAVIAVIVVAVGIFALPQAEKYNLLVPSGQAWYKPPTTLQAPESLMEKPSTIPQFAGSIWAYSSWLGWNLSLLVIFAMFFAERKFAGEPQDIWLVGNSLMVFIGALLFREGVNMVLKDLVMLVFGSPWGVDADTTLTFVGVTALAVFVVASIYGNFDLTPAATGFFLMGMIILSSYPNPLETAHTVGLWLIWTGVGLAFAEVVRPRRNQPGSERVWAVVIVLVSLAGFFPLRGLFVEFASEKLNQPFVPPTIVGFALALVCVWAVASFLSTGLLKEDQKLHSGHAGQTVLGPLTIVRSTMRWDVPIFVMFVAMLKWVLTGSP